MRVHIVVAIVSVLSLLAVYLGLGYLYRGEQTTELLVYTPPLMADSVVEFSGLFEQRHGVRVSVFIQPTGVLLNRLEVTGDGDVLFTADHVFMEQAVSRNLVDPKTIQVVSYVLPVIAISKRSNLNISVLDDLLREDVKVGIADPRVSPFGRIAVEILNKTGVYAELEKKVEVYSDVRTLTTNLVLGNIDVAILPHIVTIWHPGEVEIVWLEPRVLNGSMTCQLVAVTTKTKNRVLAELFVTEFLRYLQERGRYIYARGLEELKYLAPYDYSDIEMPRLCRP